MTLTLDGSGSGQEERTTTLTGLTPDTLYTFYLTVDADSVDVEPFLEVVGGDIDVATDGDAEELVARGTTNGSGELTVRLGVQDAAAAGLGSGSDGLNYADIAALVSAGWAHTDARTGAALTWSMDSSDTTEGAKSLKAIVPPGTGEEYYARTLTGFTPGATVRFTVDVRQSSKHWYENTQGIAFGGGGGTNYTNTTPYAAWRTLTAEKVADGSGEIEVRLRAGSTSTLTATVHWDNLRWQELGGGTATIDFTPLPLAVTDTGTALRPAA